jgi:outer membrane protein OmpA-like peptidoglycan-associated protein
MRKLLTFLFVMAALSRVSGQDEDNKWALGLLVGKTEYQGDLGSGILKFKPFYGSGAISLHRYLNPSLDLGFLGEVGNLGFSNKTLSFQARKTDLSVLLKYKFDNGYMLPEDSRVSPFLTAGVGFAGFGGTNTVAGELDAFLPVGGGIQVVISPGVALQYQFLYNFTNGDNRDLVTADRDDRFATHSVGVILTLGSKKDTDKDGVPDKSDKCPSTPEGMAVNADGCPVDGDNDGIADYLDKCPSVAGVVSLGGCPDLDGDGIADSEDNCPEIKGVAALKGCPDRDGDGIKDSDDRCPDIKGLPQLNGCPDSDNDGIIDSEDRCPDAKGPKELQGCPDSDGDGIADLDDKCPSVSGIKENKGCPAIKEETIKVFEKALTGITFETGKDIIRRSSFPILDDVIIIMKENPEYNLEIYGHTDNVGDDAKNLDLSQRRADAVKKYLSDKGTASERMTAKGYGETMPLADNNTAAGRAKNRRVEFKVNF